MNLELWNPSEQRNLAPLSVPGASSAGSIRVVSGSGFRYVVPFPYRLHEMLSDVDANHDSSIVSWLPDGRHFKVHDPRRFVEIVIPSAFKQKSLKSFQRQLHLYGFQRVHEGADKGAYYHEKFLRDDRDLCLTITRTKAPKRSRIAPTTKNNNPQKIQSFRSLKKNTDTSNYVNNMTTVEPTPVTISPTIFDDVSPLLPQLQQSSHIPEHNRDSMKGPLHKTTSPTTRTIYGPALSQPDPQLSSSTSSNIASILHQQESSVADTCQWLINAGVPISAFDPVAIGDISHSTFAVPQFVPSAASSFSPVVIHQKPTIPTALPTGDLCLSNGTSVVVKTNETEALQFNYAKNDMTSLFAFPSQNSFSISSSFQGEVVPFDCDTLLTDLLPGENLPLVDDALWAL